VSVVARSAMPVKTASIATLPADAAVHRSTLYFPFGPGCIASQPAGQEMPSARIMSRVAFTPTQGSEGGSFGHSRRPATSPIGLDPTWS